MRPKAEKYYARLIGGDDPPFRRWPLRRMTAQKARWRTRASTVFVSIVATDGRPNCVETHVSANLSDRRRGARRARERRLAFYLILPPYRNYRASEVRARIAEGRTLLDRCVIGVAFAADRDLTFCVAPEIASRIEARVARPIEERHLLTSANAVSGTES